ncbi:MAG: YajQ family cyclic di-GMP-binding protein [Armatimonadetes bacterium]|nr:YajQ family cyclic di-GMP-binding protein [Armatimonadota bacterium]
MASADFSFDIVSRVNMMEVKNAISQAQKEFDNRYDFKGSKCEMQYEKEELTLVGDDEFRLDQMKDIVFSKLVKRGIDPRQVDWTKPEPATGVTLKTKLQFKQGIAQDKAKELTKLIRDKGLKVNAQIQGEEVRVSGKSKDDLQKTITYVKGLDLPYPVDFINFR